MIEGLITREECDALAELYPIDGLFRSRVVMARHGFGRGEYKYFSYPLPDIIAGLRTALYPRLAPIANRWNTAMGIDVRYPEKHADFIARCHDAGQRQARRRCCFSTARTITTACIRTSMASTFSRSRSPSCCPNPNVTSRAANS